MDIMLRSQREKINPSEGAEKSLEKAPYEHQKCFPLCKCCQMKITRNDQENATFLAKMNNNGY